MSLSEEFACTELMNALLAFDFSRFQKGHRARQDFIDELQCHRLTVRSDLL